MGVKPLLFADQLPCRGSYIYSLARVSYVVVMLWRLLFMRIFSLNGEALDRLLILVFEVESLFITRYVTSSVVTSTRISCVTGERVCKGSARRLANKKQDMCDWKSQ